MGETELLRELHETYVWAVNAAVADGRMDLVRQLADEFTDEALHLMTMGQPPGCAQPECAICASGSQGPTVAAPRRRFWRRHH